MCIRDSLWAWYGSSGNRNATQNPSPSNPWGVGQAYSDHGVLGPWVRHPGNPVPIGGGVENPLVLRASCAKLPSSAFFEAASPVALAT